MTPIHKGELAIAHIEKISYSMLAGTYHYSRFFIVEVLKSTRDGEVKEYRDNAITNAHSKVTRFVTIYSLPAQYAHRAPTMFAAQELDFTGYGDKAALKAAFEKEN